MKIKPYFLIIMMSLSSLCLALMVIGGAPVISMVTTLTLINCAMLGVWVSIFLWNNPPSQDSDGDAVTTLVPTHYYNIH